MHIFVIYHQNNDFIVSMQSQNPIKRVCNRNVAEDLSGIAL